jgi:arabinofuranosyltransferase
MTFLQKKVIFLIATAFFAVEFYMFVWLGDDALITFRSVRNVLSGFGPVFNVGERVQSFTHPLWFLLLSAVTVLTKNVAVSFLILSAALTALTLYFICFHIARSRFGLILGLSCLFFSKAYVEYSSSGLENPLSHCLLALAIALALVASSTLKPKLLLFFLLTYSCLYLSRPDLVLLLFPLLICVLYQCAYMRERGGGFI